MAVLKKRTSMSKKRVRRSIWKKKGHLAALKALSLAKPQDIQKVFLATNK